MTAPKNELTQDGFLQRVLAYHDGTISDEQFVQLREELRADASKRELFEDVYLQGQSVRELFQITCRQAETLCREELAPVAASSPPLPGINKLGRLFCLAVAALVVFGLVVAFHFTPSTTGAPSVATVSYAELAAWVDPNRKLEVGTGLAPGEYELLTGHIRLNMPDHSTVSVAGPARFALINPELVQLYHGQVSVRTTRPEARFTIRSGDHDIVDLGTAFGVEASQDGQTHVSVFEGQVEIQSSPNRDSRGKLLLDEGNAAEALPASDMTPVSYNPDRFLNLWPLTNGIDQVSHMITFIPPGPGITLQDYRHTNKLFMMPEKQNIKIDKPIQVYTAKSWTAQELSSKPVTLFQGRVYSSYLLFFDSANLERNKWRIQGSIHFAHPIKAVITKSQALNETNLIFGREHIKYPDRANLGLEITPITNNKGETLFARDYVAISKNRRRLSFNVDGINSPDYFRVIVTPPQQ